MSEDLKSLFELYQKNIDSRLNKQEEHLEDKLNKQEDLIRSLFKSIGEKVDSTNKEVYKINGSIKDLYCKYNSLRENLLEIKYKQDYSLYEWVKKNPKLAVFVISSILILLGVQVVDIEII